MIYANKTAKANDNNKSQIHILDAAKEKWSLIHMSIHRALREKPGKEAEPSAAIIDNQSVKTAQMAGTRGFDRHKKIKGRKRHIVVDTLESA